MISRIKRPYRPEKIMTRKFQKKKKKQKLAKNTLYQTDKIHTNIHDMLQNEVNCIQIAKLISVDF